jgi:hypothetical protein
MWFEITGEPISKTLNTAIAKAWWGEAFDDGISMWAARLMRNYRSAPDNAELCDICGQITMRKPEVVRINGIHGLSNNKAKRICNNCQLIMGHCVQCNSMLVPGLVDIYDHGYIHKYTAANGENGWLCPVCAKEHNFARCEVCGDMVVDTNIKFTAGKYACKLCHDSMFTCTECEERCWGFQVVFDGVSPYCQECFDRLPPVARYNFFDDKPDFKLLEGEKREADTLFFGYELEMEHNWEKREVSELKLARLAAEHCPMEWGYMKHDGSMERGIEFTSNPMTWAWYRNQRDNFTKMLVGLQENFRTDQYDEEQERYNCSLHVHMSKNAFSSGHLYKFVKFFYKVHLRRFIQNVSGRESNFYCRYDPRDNIGVTKMAKEKGNPSGERYSVINMVGGHWHEERGIESQTVEYRLFAGTLEPIVFHKNFEFLMAAYEFTRDASMTMITQRNFFSYLKKNSNRFVNLINFINNELKMEV